MNILFVTGNDWFDSAASDWHLLAEGMAARGHHVFAIDHRWPRYGFRAHKVYQSIDIPDVSCVRDDARVHVRRPGYTNGVFKLPSVLLSHGLAVARAMKEWKIDVVVIYASLVNGWQSLAWARRFHLPAVVRMVGERPNLSKGKHPRGVAEMAERFIYRKADMILALTPDHAGYAVGLGADASKVRLLLYPLDTGLFRPLPKNTALQRELGIKDEDHVVVAMVTPSSSAGVDRLVAAFPGVLKEVPDAKLIIIGNVPSRRQVEDSARSLGIQEKVRITGDQPFRTMPDYINLADVCVNAFPINDMTDEISPAGTVQCLGCGKPVVSTALPGITSLISKHDSGVVYAATCNDMAGQIARLLRNEALARQLGEAGLEYARAVYDYEKVLDDFESSLSAEFSNRKSS